MIALCFDIGGSKFVVGMVDQNGTVLCSQREQWQALTPESMVRTLVAAGTALLVSSPAWQPDIIGVTIPGLANAENGMWVEASFSGIRNLPIAKLLGDAFGLPVYAENDAKACALAEKLYGAAQSTDTFLYLTVSNGVGGAVFSDGRLMYGAGTAGECGHVTVVEGGRLCKCGKLGCLEVYAAGPGMADTYHELTGKRISGEEIAIRARQRDAAALRVFELEGLYLGRMLGMAINLLSPALVIIGGGLSLAFDLFSESLQATMEAHVYRHANPNVQVVPTPLGYHGGLLGAAALAKCGSDGLYGYQGKVV